MPTTLSPFARRYLSSRHARGEYNEKSLRCVGPRLRSFTDHFGNRPIDRLSKRAVEAWLESLHGLAPASRAAYLASVKMFTKWLVEEGVIEADPCAGVSKIRRPRTVPRAQSAGAVAATFRACRDARDLAIIWLMVGMGLRRCEVAWLRWEDYDELGRTMRVTGKGSHERVLPVPVRVAAALAAVRVRGNTGPVITRRHDPQKPLRPETVGAIAGRILRDAGVKHAPYDGVAGHALRHTCASDVLDGGAQLTVVQEMLGHIHLSSTSIYLRRASVGQMREAMEGRAYAA